MLASARAISKMTARKGAGIDLAAAERARQEHVEEPGVDQLGDEGGRQPPILLDQRGIGLDLGRERARPGDVVFSKPHALDLSRMSHRSEALRSSSPVRASPRSSSNVRRAPIWAQMRRQVNEGRRHQLGDSLCRGHARHLTRDETSRGVRGSIGARRATMTIRTVSARRGPNLSPSGAHMRVLVTGAASGIGRATCLRLARDAHALRARRRRWRRWTSPRRRPASTASRPS